MKQTLFFLSLFVIGIAMALSGIVPETIMNAELSKWTLYLLLFFVGIHIGSNKNIFSAIRMFGSTIIWIPLATTVGTFAGVALAAPFVKDVELVDSLSVGAGFAYYSLSSIIISEYRGAELGAIALLANIMREFIVLIAAPLMVRYFGKLAPICAGGATTMDTTLPIITQNSGTEYVVIALFHGIIIDFSVPLWVSFFINLNG